MSLILKFVIFFLLGFFIGWIVNIIVHKTKCKHQYELIHVWTIIDADTKCPTGKVQVYQCNICKKIKKIQY